MSLAKRTYIPILSFVPIMNLVHLFSNGTCLHLQFKTAERVGEEVHLTIMKKDDYLFLELSGTHTGRNWDW